MYQKYNKKILAIGIAVIGLFILGLLGFTYAFFTAGVTGNENATPTIVETSTLRLVFDDTQVIVLENALPGASETKTFTVTNTSDTKLKYDINIIDVLNEYQNNELIYSLSSTNNGAVVTNEVLPNSDGNLVKGVDIDPNTTQLYTFTIKFIETGQSQDYNQGAIFRGKLQINTSVVYSGEMIFEIDETVGEIYKGENKSVNIVGTYYGNVSCESDLPDIASCSIIDNKLNIVGLNRGTANIKVIESSQNIELNYTIRILDVTLGLGSESGSVIKTLTSTVDITGNDYGTLSCESSNTSIATCSISGSVLNITGVELGSTTITVTESNKNTTVTYNITVQDVTLGLSNTSGNAYITKTKTIPITGSGYGTLSCESSNISNATCSIAGTTLSVTGVASGSAAITVKESNLNKTAVYTATIQEPLLYNYVLGESVPQSDVSIDFRCNALGYCQEYPSYTNYTGAATNGLYYTENAAVNGENGVRTYYYRGRVDNNWVSFGGFLWRMVRTTSEGGVKLIYAGDGSSTSSGFIPAVSYFNESNWAIYHVGYTYNTAEDGYEGDQTNSTIKNAIDAWYTTNLNTYSGYLSTTAIYCADRSNVIELEDNTLDFPTYTRFKDGTRPTFNCPTANASKYTVSIGTGNGYLQYPIALLSLEEIMYAGLSKVGFYTNMYILDNATSNQWWTMTPINWSYFPYVAMITPMGNWNQMGSSDAEINVRPSVSLKSCVRVINGNGTKVSPYTITNTNC